MSLVHVPQQVYYKKDGTGDGQYQGGGRENEQEEEVGLLIGTNGGCREAVK
jgi:hypothetical protein